MKGLVIEDLLSEASKTGSVFCVDLTKRMDQFIEEIFKDAGAPSEVTVCAVGGYGRKELCPGSDIDVLLIHDELFDISEVAEKIWYPLWDAGLKLGHQVGTQKRFSILQNQILKPPQVCCLRESLLGIKKSSMG